MTKTSINSFKKNIKGLWNHEPYVKKYLTRYMSNDHVYGRKIGFHTPTSKYIYQNGRGFLLDIKICGKLHSVAYKAIASYK